MSCSLKTLPLALALAALNLFTASCVSNQQAQVRFVHAIQDGAAMDIDITGPNQVTPTQAFTAVSFRGVQPNQPGYTAVPSGTDMIEGFLAGTTNVGFNSASLNLAGAQRYTLVATGFVANGQNATILPVPDNIPTPSSGFVAFRVINASPSGPGGSAGTAVDVYVLLNPATGPSGNPTFPGVAYQHASGYVSLPYNPNNDTIPPGFTVYATAAGSTTPIYISEGINPANGGAVRTLVLTDVQNGNSMNSTFLELSDLN
jgi:Domain of unknown function (DUF4397)